MMSLPEGAPSLGRGWLGRARSELYIANCLHCLVDDELVNVCGTSFADQHFKNELRVTTFTRELHGRVGQFAQQDYEYVVIFPFARSLSRCGFRALAVITGETSRTGPCPNWFLSQEYAFPSGMARACSA
jgi:hypothetical protein